MKSNILHSSETITIAIIAMAMFLTGAIAGIAIGGMPVVDVNAETIAETAQETETVVGADVAGIENPEEFFLTSTICGYDTPVSVFTNLLTGQTWATVYIGDREIGNYTLLDPESGEVYRCYNIYETCDEIDNILNWNVEQGIVVIPVG